MTAAGRVFAHVGQAFDSGCYDFAVVGGGRMGLAVAFYLKRFAPRARVLVVERGGIPSEDGATLRARGVWHQVGLPPSLRPRARWVREVWRDPAAETGTVRPHDPQFQEVGWAGLLREDEQDEQAAEPGDLDVLSPKAFLARLPPRAQAQVLALTDFPRVRRVMFDSLGGYGNASTLALAYGYGAVRLGADLLLNAEARLTSQGLNVRRLDITNRMEVVVAREVGVTAGHVVVAAGSEGPELLERDLGLATPCEKAYAQFPHLSLSPVPGLPLLSFAGFALRPEGGGFRVLPPTEGADPPGYVPRGAKLNGVPTGTRREVLRALLGALDDWPAFGEAGLDLGKTVFDLPGAWEARPPGGWPLWQRISEHVSLLLGGPEADRLGPAAALDLAATLTNVLERPWQG